MVQVRENALEGGNGLTIFVSGGSWEVLSKGLSLSVAPKRPNILDFLFGIKLAAQQLYDEDADQFRCEARIALSNLTKNELNSLKALKK